MARYVRSGYAVEVFRGFQTQITCVQRVRGHFDDSDFAYECGQVRHCLRRSTGRASTSVSYIPTVSVVERITCDCGDCFSEKDLDSLEEVAMLDCIKQTLRPQSAPDQVKSRLFRSLERICSCGCD